MYPPGGKTHFTIFGDQGPAPAPPSPNRCQIERTKSQVFNDTLENTNRNDISSKDTQDDSSRLSGSPTTTPPDVFHATDHTWTLEKMTRKRQSELYAKYNQSRIF